MTLFLFFNLAFYNAISIDSGRVSHKCKEQTTPHASVKSLYTRDKTANTSHETEAQVEPTQRTHLSLLEQHQQPIIASQQQPNRIEIRRTPIFLCVGGGKCTGSLVWVEGVSPGNSTKRLRLITEHSALLEQFWALLGYHTHLLFYN